MPQVAYYEYETSPRKVAPRTTNVKKAKPKQSKKEQEEARKKLELQKETDQLEVAIQNSLNLNTVEQSAKELLGMQKLTVKQSVYIELPKKDYVEPKMQEVIIKEDNSLFTRLSKRIKDLF